jgi:hypothetical protein
VNQGWKGFIEGLNRPGGRIAVLVFVLVVGLVADALGVPYAEHIVMATLAVLLVAVR